MRSLIFFGLLAIFLGGSVQAQTVHETLEVNYYPISGSKLGQLRKQLPSGRWGSTRWNLKHSANCEITLKIVVTLPKLQDPSQLQPEDHQKYEAMFRALKSHEMDHVKIVRKGARDLEQTNCQNPKAIFAAINRAHKSYDTRTVHGWRQGVRLN